jgi:endonuclease/exonuclease/phosphatase family metal-dependent hydrolase
MEMRIVTFNVHYGKNAALIADTLKNNEHLSGADVILLQEIEEHASEKVSRVKKIADALGLAYLYAPARAMGKTGTHGLAILARQQPEDPEIIALPFYKFFFDARKRIALTAAVRLGKYQVRIANVHLDTRLTSEERVLQIKPVIEALKKDPETMAVVGGDLNTLPFRFRRTMPFAYFDQRKYLHTYFEKEGFLNHCEDSGYTLKMGFVEFRLDGIYARNLEVLTCGVERSVNVSDHKPLWIDVEVKNKSDRSDVSIAL